MGESFTFDIEIRRGAGAYIAGEETALINSLEVQARRAAQQPPFHRPVRPFRQPTAVTTSRRCCRSLRSSGSRPSLRGRGNAGVDRDQALLLSGCVEVPGLYEYDFGVTLRARYFRCWRDGRRAPLAGAVLLAARPACFVGHRRPRHALTFEGVRAAGARPSAPASVLDADDTVSVTALLRRITQFFRDESCGQCVPCRVGTVRQEELVARLAGPSRSAPSPRSLNCCPTSATSPATRRSAASARPPSRRSSPPSSWASSVPTPRGPLTMHRYLSDDATNRDCPR